MITRRLVPTMLLALVCSVSAAGATDQDVFRKLLGKVAPDSATLILTFRPKMACACPANGGTADPGVLARDPTGKIRCGEPAFDADGKVVNLIFCDVFEVLGR